MITFAELQDGTEFVCNGLLYMKIPAVKTSKRKCDDCGVGINAITIGRQGGVPLTDSFGYPMLPWGVHFCPSEKIDDHAR